MKLLFLISSLDDGGAAAIVSQLTTHIPTDIEIDIVLNSSENIRFPYRGNILDLGIKSPNDRSRIGYQIRVFFCRYRKIRSLKQNNDYSACISYLDSANVINIITNHFGRCKSVINVVQNMSEIARVNMKYRLIVNPLIRFFYNRADCIIAQTQEIRDDLKNHYRICDDKIRVNYSAVDVERIQLINKKKTPDPSGLDLSLFSGKTVVNAGRLTEQKGQWHLIRAFSDVVRIVPDAILVIIGEGILEKYLNSLICEYGLERNVYLTGFTKDYTWYISRSAVFCFSSIHEGFGIALQEAMACGVACVASDYKSGARELLNGGYQGDIESVFIGKYGVITPELSEKLSDSSIPLDVSEKMLANALVRMLTDDELRTRLAREAFERIEEYDLNSIVANWMRIISETC